MKALLLVAAATVLVLPAAPAAAQYGATGPGYQSGVVEQPAEDDNVGVDDGSGIIQGQTELHHNKAKTKKKKDPDCHWVQKKGYKEKTCW
jgi:hypothetical protein